MIVLDGSNNNQKRFVAVAFAVRHDSSWNSWFQSGQASKVLRNPHPPEGESSLFR